MGITRRTAASTTDYLLLFVLAALFGISFTLTRIAVTDIPPLTLAAGRVLIATVIIVPIMLLSGQRLPGAQRIWLPVSVASVTGYALPFTLVSWGQVAVPSGLASIFMAVMPLFTIVLAHCFTEDEKLNSLKVVGVLCGIGGVASLFGFHTLLDIGNTNVLSQLAILMAAFCYAINALVTRALVDFPRLSMLAAQLLISTLLMVPASVLLEQPALLSPQWQALCALLLLALGPTALATLLILIIVDRQGAGFLSQINFLVPLFGVAFGWMILNETISNNAWLALSIILFGLMLTRRAGQLPTGRQTSRIRS